MVPALRIPAGLQEATDHGGAERRTWLHALPARVAHVVERWGLELGEPFEPGGSCSWVAPARGPEGADLVLKVAWRHTEALHEAEGLAALGAGAAARVLAYEHLGELDDATALLLERCRPGAELRSRPEAEQHVVLTGLLAEVWAVALPAEHPFRPLAAMVDDWATRGEAWLAAHPGALDRGLARSGLDLLRDLSRPAADDVLLFTDVHAGNVLSGERRPWLLIDPKPYVGDRHYDVLQHLLNCGAALQRDPQRLVATVAELADLDAERLGRWLVARCIQEQLHDGPAWPGLDAVVRRLGGA